ncbi:MAG: hypothetical protein IKU08_08030 [Clostridia bacterium]|nr:hypothetical protein [Clostridia bacterium]
MENEKAWKRFLQTGSVADYLEFRGCVNSTAGVKNENVYRRTGAQSNRYGGK